MLLIIIILYFALLMIISRLTRGEENNTTFFTGNRKSPWYLVAFGMIGATISGISLVSVPGMVETGNWYYLQTCLGFFVGYIVVAYVLLPIYYKLGLTSIYEYLNDRYGKLGNKTGSMLFVVAKLISSATKLYVVVLILQQFILNNYNIPFWLTTLICVFLIWAYTRRGGIKTIVWTDTLQTTFLIISMLMIFCEGYNIVSDLSPNQNINWNIKIFNFTDWSAPSHFVKQFFSGIFIVIVMTGLDQDMMQKSLTISTLKQSQRNMISYGAAFIPVNIILLLIGSLSVAFFANTSLPVHGDKILPYFVENHLSYTALIFLIIGVISATFSSADSALTAITTTLSVDIFDKHNTTKFRQTIHILVCIVFSAIVILIEQIETKSILDTIYKVVGYAYGPLLGLFAFGLTTKQQVRERAIPLISIASPILCYTISSLSIKCFNYYFGYELLMLNGLICYTLLYMFKK